MRGRLLVTRCSGLRPAAGRSAVQQEQMPGRSQRKRIVIIDDHHLLRQGLERLLNSTDEFVVCGEAGAAREGIAIILETRPDAAIVDIGLPDKDGLELTREIKKELPKLPVVILSMHEEL